MRKPPAMRKPSSTRRSRPSARGVYPRSDSLSVFVVVLALYAACGSVLAGEKADTSSRLSASKKVYTKEVEIDVRGPSGVGNAESWKAETVLVSKKGDLTVVRGFKEPEIVLYQHKDAQLAIEWAMAKARTTVVLAGEYMTNDSIDAPRDGVTLIIDQGASIKLDPNAKAKSNLTFRSSSSRGKYSQQIVPLIWVRRNNVRVYNFGDLQPSGWNHPDQELPKPELYKDRSLRFIKEEITGCNGQTFPVVFDGRNEELTTGVDGGVLVATGTGRTNFFLCLDAKNMQVPLICSEPSGNDAVLCMEGCVDANVGMVVNLAKDKYGKCGETVDLNACNQHIKFETLIGERSKQIIDVNASQADVKELVSIGKPQQLSALSPGSGNRWTYRDRPHKHLQIDKTTILDEDVDVKRIITVPKLPEALPCFTVKATVEVTMDTKAGEYLGTFKPARGGTRKAQAKVFYQGLGIYKAVVLAESPDGGQSRIKLTAGMDWDLGAGMDVRRTNSEKGPKGVNYSYYEGKWDSLPDFDALTPKKTGEAEWFDIGPHDRPDDFAFKFSGFIRIARPGKYTFATTSDDGSCLFIGGEKIVDNDGLHGMVDNTILTGQPKAGSVVLKKGMHPIVVTYFEKNGEEGLKVMCSAKLQGDEADEGLALSGVVGDLEWKGRIVGDDLVVSAEGPRGGTYTLRYTGKSPTEGKLPPNGN